MSSQAQNKAEQGGQNAQVVSEDASREEARKEREKTQGAMNRDANNTHTPGTQKPVPGR